MYYLHRGAQNTITHYTQRMCNWQPILANDLETQMDIKQQNNKLYKCKKALHFIASCINLELLQMIHTLKTTLTETKIKSMLFFLKKKEFNQWESLVNRYSQKFKHLAGKATITSKKKLKCFVSSNETNQKVHISNKHNARHLDLQIFKFNQWDKHLRI